MRQLASLSLATVLLFSAPALAQPLSQETADQLAAEMNTSLNEAIGPYSQNIKFEAPISAGITTDAYIINISPATITLEGEVLKLPGTTATMRPTGTDSYIYESTFPSPIKVEDAQGHPLGELTIASQKTNGSWKRGVQGSSAFPTTSVRLAGLLYKSATGAELSKVASLAVNITSALDEGGKLDQTTTLKIGELVARDQTGKYAISIGEAALETFLVDADPKAIEAMRVKSAEMQKSIAAAQDTPGSSNALNATVANSLSDIVGGYARVGGSSLLKLRLSNVNYLDKSSPMLPTTFKVATVALGGELKADPATGFVNYSTVYKHGGLELSPAPSDLMADFLPKILSLNLVIENLPVQELLESAAKTVRTQGTPEANASFAEAQAALVKAKTMLKVNEFAAMTPTLATSLKGQLAPSAQSPRGVIGGFDGVIKGLDEYLANMKVTLLAAQKAGDTETMQSNQATFMGLTVLQGMGEPIVGAKGSSRSYKIILGNDGQLTINGMPMPGLPGM